MTQRLLRQRIIPVVVTAEGHAGLTLWAADDIDGEVPVHTLLGPDDHILAFATATELAAHISDPANPTGLDKHPSWRAMTRRPPSELRAGHDSIVEFDAVPEIASGPLTAKSVETICKAVRFAAVIAAVCDDEDLGSFLDETEAYRSLEHGYPYFTGRWGNRAWRGLSAEIDNSWGWISGEVAAHIEWIGETASVDIEELTTPHDAPNPWTFPRVAGSSAGQTTVSDAVLPSRATTVWVTLFFGLFGMIPAASASRQARTLGVSTNRYWSAFWLTFLGSIAAWIVLIAMMGAVLAAST